MDPLDALIGTVLLGAGFLFLYGAYRNKRVLGADGILAKAISKGSIASLDEVADAGEPIIGKMVARQPKGPQQTRDAVAAIAVADKSLAFAIDSQLTLVDANSTRADLMPLAQLLAIADGKGFAVSTASIRAYVKDVTDESI